DINGTYDKFIGSWKYQDASANPTEIFEIVFSKKEMHDFSGNYFEDRIYGQFRYIKNGQIIFNTMYSIDHTSTQLINGGYFNDPTNTNKISLSYKEPGETSNTRKSRLFLEFVPGNPHKIKWLMEWVPLDDNIPPPKLPTEMLLNKVP
uniref:DUF6705 family protein n=1 Tax=uncultured Flavobacterium sp. TaxID=165435 RepID=UPI0025F3B35A